MTQLPTLPQFPAVARWGAPPAEFALVPGAALFLPAGAVFSLRRAIAGPASAASGAAACLLVALPTHAPWAAAMAAALDAAQEDLPALAPDRRLFPHAPSASPGGGALRQALKALFERAAEAAASAAAPSRAAGLSAAHYDVAEYLHGRYDLEALLDAGGGLAKARPLLPVLCSPTPSLVSPLASLTPADPRIKIPNFLPLAVAERLRDLVEAIADDEWVETAAAESADHNDIAHSFLSATSFPNAAAAQRCLSGLLPAQRCVVSAGCYSGGGHHIAAHDDRAYRAVAGGARHSRTVAVVLHLSRGAWGASCGGQFCDLERGEEHCPAFNTLFAFRVPRWHAVKPPAPGAPGRRLSLFGWFLRRGEAYALEGREGAPSDAPY